MNRQALYVTGTNRLVELLPPKDRARVLALTEPVSGEAHEVLFQGGAALTHVYFPTAGFLTVRVRVPGQSSVEVGIVGAEGMAGLALLHRTTRNHTEAAYKVSGRALRMPAGAFLRELRLRGAFEDVLHRYAEGFLTQLAQSIACSLHHTLDQRLSRYLLMYDDRMAGAPIRLTQEQIAKTLGVRRRASVTVAAARLETAGLITYSRGVVRLLARARLVRRSCDCYKEVRAEFERLLG